MMKSETSFQASLPRRDKEPGQTSYRNTDGYLDVSMTGTVEERNSDHNIFPSHPEQNQIELVPGRPDPFLPPKENPQTAHIDRNAEEQWQRDILEQREKQLIQETYQRRALEAELQQAKAIELSHAQEKVQWQTKEMELRNEITLKVPYDDYAKLHETAHSQHAELETVRAELKSKYTELVDVRRRWKQLARELEKAKRQSHNVYQITDQELVQRFERLRYNISNFSMRYFGIGTMTTYCTQYFKKYLTTVIPDGHKIYHYLDSKVHRPILIQSFLWRVISGEVLDCALWAGGKNGSLQNLLDLLRPDKPKTDPSYSQVERNYHHWRAMTTGLIMEAPECAAGKNACTEYYKHVISKNIYETIRIVPDADEPRIDWAEYQQDLLEILDEAIVLDRDIYRQASHVRWLFQLPANAVFDSATMRLLKGEEPTEGHGQVEILIAPGLLKTGRSTGEDYDIENLLVPQEVSCKPAFVPRR